MISTSQTWLNLVCKNIRGSMTRDCSRVRGSLSFATTPTPSSHIWAGADSAFVTVPHHDSSCLWSFLPTSCMIQMFSMDRDILVYPHGPLCRESPGFFPLHCFISTVSYRSSWQPLRADVRTTRVNDDLVPSSGSCPKTPLRRQGTPRLAVPYISPSLLRS